MYSTGATDVMGAVEGQGGVRTGGVGFILPSLCSSALKINFKQKTSL